MFLSQHSSQGSLWDSFLHRGLMDGQKLILNSITPYTIRREQGQQFLQEFPPFFLCFRLRKRAKWARFSVRKRRAFRLFPPLGSAVCEAQNWSKKICVENLCRKFCLGVVKQKNSAGILRSSTVFLVLVGRFYWHRPVLCPFFLRKWVQLILFKASSFSKNVIADFDRRLQSLKPNPGTSYRTNLSHAISLFDSILTIK